MPFAADSVWVNVSTSGLTDFTTATALNGYRTFAGASVPNGAIIHYSARTATEFENGEGAYNSGTGVVARTTIFASSNAGAKVNFGSSPTLAITPLAEDAIFPPASSTDNAIVLWDGTAGDAVKNSAMTVSGAGALSGTNTGDQTITLTGDVTGSGTGSFATTIANNVVTNTDLVDMAAATIKGRAVGAGTGDPTDLTGAQVIAVTGAALASVNLTAGAGLTGGGDLTAARTFDVIGSTSIIVGANDVQRAALTGDVTAAQNVNATAIANDAVTYAKMQNVSAASKLLGRGSAGGAGDPEEITLGTNLTMTGTTLDAAGGASLPIVGDGLTVTANAPLLDLSQTWNNAAVPFQAVKINVTATAYNATSAIFECQVGGLNRFSVRPQAGPFILVQGVSAQQPRYQAGLDGDTIQRINFGLDTSDRPLVSFGPGGSTARDTTLTRTGVSQLTFDSVGANLVIASGSITADAPSLNLSQSWNNGAVAFTGIKFNLSSNTSASGSKLLDLQIGGTSRCSITSSGPIATFTGLTAAQPRIQIQIDGDTAARISLNLDSSNAPNFGFGPGNASRDTFLYRDAAAVFAQRDGVNVQTFRVYRTFTDSSNYERLAISSTAGVMEISAETAGTGTDDIGVRLNSVGTGSVWLSSSGGVIRAVTAGVERLRCTLAGDLLLHNGVAPPAGGSSVFRLTFGNVTNGLGIYVGSGVPTVTAAQGSIYLRTDGSSTSTRLYVNTTGAATWTNVTTAT